MIKLPQVTLCCVDGVGWKLAARSLGISRRECDFADTICFSLDHPATDADFRTVQVDELKSVSGYTPFLMKRLNEFIKTDFVLVTQWDGYVIHPEAWSNDFLNYDYIGAKWYWFPKYRVGNGGFSLRSKRLLEALQDPRFQLHDGLGEDQLICQGYRPYLESEFGIKFAPEEIADQFSYECTPVPNPTFGFHGIMNLSREVGPEDWELMLPHVPKCVATNPHWLGCLSAMRNRQQVPA